MQWILSTISKFQIDPTLSGSEYKWLQTIKLHKNYAVYAVQNFKRTKVDLHIQISKYAYI